MFTPPADQKLLAMLQEDSEQAIDLIFRKYYGYLCRSVYRILPDQRLVEDMAQEVFYELWRKRDRLHINTSLQAYLKRSAINKALNYLRDTKVKFEDEERAPVQKSQSSNAQEQMETAELKALIHSAIEDLPERCRIIFSLSRYENMSYQEIAEQLNISPKTVENQISRALRQLRQAIRPYINRSILLIGVIFTIFF